MNVCCSKNCSRPLNKMFIQFKKCPWHLENIYRSKQLFMEKVGKFMKCQKFWKKHIMTYKLFAMY